MAMSLDQIVPWGRSFDEYSRMFDLDAAIDLGPVLDCGSGPASFGVEAAQAGMQVVSVDPIYRYSGDEIRRRFQESEETVLSQVRDTPSDWTWSYHRDVETLRRNRRSALDKFLEDYEPGKRMARYILGALPALPFPDGAFPLAVCSHLLFLYSGLLAPDFHVRSVLELCRVAEEIRIFPLLTLACELSPHVAEVRAILAERHWDTEIRTVPYELQRGGNQMLRVFRR